MPFPDFSDLVKELYVASCGRHFRLGDKKLTDSRISLLTGLQRRDIRAIRARLDATDGKETLTDPASPLARVIAYWSAQKPYGDGKGNPRPLPRSAPESAPTFDGLVAAISRDIHPRTIFDEMLRRGLISHDTDRDRVTLNATVFVPSADDEDLLHYFGANLGDHTAAAAENLAHAPEAGPFFERAVHYDSLSPESVSALDEMARKLQTDVLEQLNAEALALQERDDGRSDATCRFRCGAFIFTETQRAET